MEADVLGQLIGNVGFPIAAFAAMYYMCMSTLKEFRNSMDEFKVSNDALVKSVESICAKLESKETN